MAPYDHDPPPKGEGAPRGASPRCPICAKPTDPARKPFCSKRCADIDLHRWLQGVYHVPTNEPPEDDADPKDGKG